MTSAVTFLALFIVCFSMAEAQLQCYPLDNTCKGRCFVWEQCKRVVTTSLCRNLIIGRVIRANFYCAPTRPRPFGHRG